MSSTKNEEQFQSRFKDTRELNEWLRCRADPRYFINKYCYIYGSVDAGKIRFRTYKFQDYVILNLKEYRLNVIKKPRQMGITWLACAMGLWLTNFYSYKNVVIISIKEDNAIRFLYRIKFIYKNLPMFLRSEITNGKRNDFGTKTAIEFSNASRLWSIPSSEDAGRSESVSWLIIDEAAFIQHMEHIWAAAYPTLSTGGSMLLLSTTNGVGNRYHKVYTEAASGANNFNAIDLRWYHHPDRDQAWYDQQKADLGPRLTAQEVDGDFLSSGDNVFNLNTIRSLEENIREGRYKTISRDHFYDYNKRIEMIEIERYKINPDLRSPRVINLDNYHSNEILIWSQPVKGVRYVVGVDTAKNRAGKEDNSAIVVMNVETMDTVFEFRGKIGSDLLPSFVARIGYYYNEALLCIENTGIGLATVMGVFNLNYPKEKIYADQDHKVKRDNRFDYDKNENELGFSTNVRSKPIMIADLNSALEDGSLVLKSFAAINEFNTYVTDTTGSMGAAKGYTDDLVMAYALAIQGRKMASRTGFNDVMVGTI